LLDDFSLSIVQIAIKPVAAAPSATAASHSGVANADSLLQSITQAGELVRDLKSKKAAKPEVDAAVSKLLALKVRL
jgi:bifunctional glutamyl/prolyl-tRNA synthetase